jgi:hypothetical protein
MATNTEGPRVVKCVGPARRGPWGSWLVLLVLTLSTGQAVAWQPEFCDPPPVPHRALAPEGTEALRSAGEENLLAMLRRGDVVHTGGEAALAESLKDGLTHLTLWGPIERWDEFDNPDPAFLLRAIHVSREEVARFLVEPDGFLSRSWFASPDNRQSFQGSLRDSMVAPEDAVAQAEREFGVKGHSPQWVFTVGGASSCSFPTPCVAFKSTEGIGLMRAGRESWLYLIPNSEHPPGVVSQDGKQRLFRAACKVVAARPIETKQRDSDPAPPPDAPPAPGPGGGSPG